MLYDARRVLVLCLLLLLPASGRTAVLTADSCEEADVQAKITLAADGDTVAVPAGFCQWSTRVTIPNTKGITLQGAGIGVTTIQDRLTGSTGLLELTTAAGKFYRVTGFTFDYVGQESQTSNGSLQVYGTTKTFRIDHNRWNLPRRKALYISGDLWGVIDHNTFVMRDNSVSRVFHGNWEGVGIHGHNSYAAAPEWGSEKFVFFEDNVFDWGTANTPHSISDTKYGGRIVVRYNTSNGHVGNHGTEAESTRGGRSFEIYNNTFHRDPSIGQWPQAINLRSGTGVAFNNIVSGRFTKLATINTYRAHTKYTEWGQCNGRNAFDENLPGGPFLTGTHNGGNNSTIGTSPARPLLVDTTKSWTVDQWKGYHANNTTQNVSGYVISNTATTMTIEVPANPPTQVWNTGNGYQLWKAIRCIDQVGVAGGDLLTGTSVSVPPTPAAWPNQDNEGFYFWDNTVLGEAPDISHIGNAQPTQTVLNTHYWIDTPRPGYTPYTYPHPLTGGGGEPSTDYLGWWKFDETSGLVVSDELALNPGALVNLDSTAAHVLGNQGRAIECDSDGYVNIPDDPTLDMSADQDFTAMVRVNTATPMLPSLYPVLFGKTDTDGTRDEWGMYRAASNDAGGVTVYFQVFVAGTGYGCHSTIPIDDSKWHHLAFTREGDTLRCSHNGQFLQQDTHANISSNLSNSSPVRLCHSDGGAYAPGVRVDDARLYDRALPQSEIAQIAGEGDQSPKWPRGRGRVKWSGAVRVK